MYEMGCSNSTSIKLASLNRARASAYPPYHRTSFSAPTYTKVSIDTLVQ
jgi:hypothetical protein